VVGWRAGVLPEDGGACGNGGWSMHSALRTDVHQAQLAPLMAALLGVPAPTNGMFVLPVHLLEENVAGMQPNEFPVEVPPTPTHFAIANATPTAADGATIVVLVMSSCRQHA
jgi:hypothetical protein